MFLSHPHYQPRAPCRTWTTFCYLLICFGKLVLVDTFLCKFLGHQYFWGVQNFGLVNIDGGSKILRCQHFFLDQNLGGANILGGSKFLGVKFYEGQNFWGSGKRCHQLCYHKATEATGCGEFTFITANSFPNGFPNGFSNELTITFTNGFSNKISHWFWNGFSNGILNGFLNILPIRFSNKLPNSNILLVITFY